MSSALRLRTPFAAFITAFSAILASLFISPAPASAASMREITYDSTISSQGQSYELAYARAGNRIFFAIDRGQKTPGAIGWIDADTGERSSQVIELSTAEPFSLAVDETRGRLLVLHYRVGTLDVIDLHTNQVTSTITGMPKAPGAFAVNQDTGQAYVVDKKILVVDIDSASVAEGVAVSNQKYPLLKAALYDSSTKLLWVAEGRDSVVTAFDTTTNTWRSDISIPIGSFVYDGAALGGRPAQLALDPVMHSLYVAVAPTMRDNWSEVTKLVTINTTTKRHIGAPITLGNTVREIAVNPRTHEILAVNGYDNSVSLVSPSSWKVASTVDLNAHGVTSGTGAGNAAIWGMAFNSSYSKLYVVHPYTSKISSFTFTGQADKPVARADAPGQGQDTPTPEESSRWEGPKAPEASTAALSGSILTWGFSEYAQGWESTVLGSKVSFDKTSHEFTFSEGKASYDESSGTTTVVWSEGFSMRPYAGLVPDMKFIFGNPVLTVHSDGSGTLSMDMAVHDAQGATKGYSRVNVATFAAGAIAVTEKNQDQARGQMSLSLTGAPEYAGRQYTDSIGKLRPNSWPADFLAAIPVDMQPWFYTTGASMDSKKVPAPIKAHIIRAALHSAPNDSAIATPSSSSQLSTPTATQPDRSASQSPKKGAKKLAWTGANIGVVGTLALFAISAGSAGLWLRRRRS